MKVLMLGPLTPPYNGQAVAFTIIAESFLPTEKLLINTSRYKYSITNTLYTIIYTFYAFLFHRFSTIYFTSSRSSLGFMKDLPMLLLGRWRKKRIINHLHGADFKIFYDQSNILNPIIKYAYQYVDTSIVLIDEMKREFIDFPQMKIKTVNNCFAKEFDQEQMNYPKKLQILYLSNLMKSKGILEFMDASSFLLEQIPYIEIKIAGSPMMDEYMNKKSINSAFLKKYQDLKNRFHERINYLGIIKGKEKINLLFESSIFILPSYYITEAYPLSIIEAMRTGNAIITTNHNYLPLIIKPGNGIIIEPRSVKSIIQGVKALLNDKQKLKIIQENNIIEAKSKYSQLRYIEEVKSIIMA